MGHICVDCGKEFLKYIHIMVHDCKTKEEAKMKNTDELKVTKEELKIGFSWEPKKKEVSKKEEINPIGKVIRFKSNVDKGKLLTGYCEGHDYMYYSVYYQNSKWSISVERKRIVEAYDVVIHKPKEVLSVQQESANFGYQAVQGIIEAHKDREEPKMYNCRCVPLKKVPLTFSDFDTSVKRTWKDQDFKDAVSNASLGLTGEAGEVADLIKKAIYHERGFKDTSGTFKGNGYSPMNKAIDYVDVKDELSDVLFYLSAMAQEFGFTLEDVARHNKEKLEKRYEKGFTVEESAKKKDKQSKWSKDYFEDKEWN